MDIRRGRDEGPQTGNVMPSVAEEERHSEGYGQQQDVQFNAPLLSDSMFEAFDAYLWFNAELASNGTPPWIDASYSSPNQINPSSTPGPATDHAR